MIPVYLNRARKNLIMSLRVKCGKNKTTLYQKGISLIGWTIWTQWFYKTIRKSNLKIQISNLNLKKQIYWL